MSGVESLIDNWLTLPVWASVGSLLVLKLVCASVCYVLLASGPVRRYAAEGGRVSPAMVMSVSVLFALLTGFLGSDIASRVTRAYHAVADEARALTMIEALTQGGSERFVNLRKLGTEYARLVIDEELSRGAEGGESPAVTRSLEELKRESAGILGSDAPTSRPLLDAALLLSEARMERLIVQQETAGFQWFTVITLSLLMIVALGLVHLDNLKGVVPTWAVYIAAAVTVLGMLAIRDNPFGPPIRVSSAPLEAAAGGFSKGTVHGPSGN